MEQNKKTQGSESMKAPKSPTDMIIAPDVLSGALNAGRLSRVDVYLSLGKEKRIIYPRYEIETLVKSGVWGQTVEHFGSSLRDAQL